MKTSSTTNGHNWSATLDDLEDRLAEDDFATLDDAYEELQRVYETLPEDLDIERERVERMMEDLGRLLDLAYKSDDLYDDGEY